MATLARHLLLVEDETAFAEGLLMWLCEIAVPPWEVTIAGTLQEAIAWLAGHTPTAILLDLNLPDSRELQTFEAMLLARGAVPIVVITVLRGPDIAARVVSAGMSYVDKYTIAQQPLAFLDHLDTFLAQRLPHVPGAAS